jgi:glycosyltransferase involved in cell wall biosynthesis
MSTARTLRILETPPRYPPFVGGVENVAQEVCNRLAAQGDDVLVICADEPRGAWGTDSQVAIHRLPWRMKIANTNITITLPLVLARTDWEVVSTHMPTPWSADWSVIIARLLGRASVVTFHNAIVGNGRASLMARIYRATFFRLLLRLTDLVIVVSDFWKEQLLSIDGSIGDKIRVSPNGVDLGRFQPGTGGNGRRLLFVGVLDQFHRYKGLDLLLMALADLDVPFELAVVGDGELREEYQGLSECLGISDSVQFLGFLDDDSLRDAYRSSDIYILPSRAAGQEAGFTLTALEAMASGLPVVLTDGVGQLARNAEEAAAGVRVPAGSTHAISGALRRLLLDDQERQRLGRNARRYVEQRHSWDAIALQRRYAYLEAAQVASARRERNVRTRFRASSEAH